MSDMPDIERIFQQIPRHPGETDAELAARLRGLADYTEAGGVEGSPNRQRIAQMSPQHPVPDDFTLPGEPDWPAPTEMAETVEWLDRLIRIFLKDAQDGEPWSVEMMANWFMRPDDDEQDISDEEYAERQRLRAGMLSVLVATAIERLVIAHQVVQYRGQEDDQ